MGNIIEYGEYRGVASFELESKAIRIATVGLSDELTICVRNAEEVESAFKKMIEAYLRQCREDGVEPEVPNVNTTLCIRLKANTMIGLEAEAMALGRSKNYIVNKILSERYS